MMQGPTGPAKELLRLSVGGKRKFAADATQGKAKIRADIDFNAVTVLKTLIHISHCGTGPSGDISLEMAQLMVLAGNIFGGIHGKLGI